MVVAPNGTMVGQPGFPRGNVLRSTQGFGDPAMVNLIPYEGSQRRPNDIRANDLMCKSTQTSQTQTDGSPRLQAPAGAAIALRYQENGHVTLPQNQPGKPDNRGTVYVYGTTQPSPDDAFLAIHRQWTADGKGGDGRGVLLSTQNFDDGQCYQVNGGSISQQRQKQFSHTASPTMGGDLWCQQDIALPADLPANRQMTLYWVWDWPTMPGTAGFPDGKQEIYTTCMDIDIVDSSSVEPVSKGSVNYQQGQDLNNAAISSQMADITNPTAVTGKFIPLSNAPTSLTSSAETIAFSTSAAGPATGQAATESASAAQPGATSADPDFLSVHTTSTPGAAGLETQTFSVIPIGGASPTTVPGGFTTPGAAPQQTSQPQPQNGQQTGVRFGGGNNFSGMPANCTHVPPPPFATASPPTRPNSVSLPPVVTITVTVTQTQNQKRANVATGFDNIGSATNIPEATGTGMQTVTQWVATAYETEVVTQWITQFDKRAAPAPTVSEDHSVYRLKARNPF